MSAPCRAFAIVPAAGNSRRMGQDKLLLAWTTGSIIEATLAAWKSSNVTAAVAVVRPDDDELATLCRRAGAEVVVPPTAPPHMRDSVQYALNHIAHDHHPAADDVWLLAPADMPHLSPAIVNHLLAAHVPRMPAILTPTLAGHRGHPVLFPWPLARHVEALPEGRGINALQWDHQGREVPCDHLGVGPEVFADVDTPEQYEQSRPAGNP